jgi:DnaJ family protein A protein 2
MSQDLYGILELSKGADSSEIRKQYLKLSRSFHPDKAPAQDKEKAEEKFKKIVHAYEILSDDEKRMFYDQTGQIPGEQGNNGGGHPFGGGMPFGMPGMPGMPFDMNNLFGMFGGRGGQGPRNGRRPGKAPVRKTQIPLTLKDFYNGRKLQIHLERQRFCNDCKGEGSVSVKSCADCSGSGVKRQIIQMGPMIMDNTGPCGSCRGSGKTKGDNCTTCSGSKFVKQDKDLELNVTKGMKSGDTVLFSGESSNIEEYTEPGDVVVELLTADEDHGWDRVGDNLKNRVGLTLGEALCGKVVKLDGHPGYESGFFVQIPAGVQNRQEIIIEGCGMPRNGQSGFGDIILMLTVIATKEERSILESQKETLQRLFMVNTNSPEGAVIVWQAKPLTY